VSASLLYLTCSQNKTCIGLKPVAAGCDKTEQGWRNQDALQLQQLCAPPLPYHRVNPIALISPLAPHIAAAEQGVTLSAEAIASHCAAVLQHGVDLGLVEGAGGWRVPLNDSESLADVAKKLQLPVVLVVGLRLGCINHALLSADAIRGDGLKLAAWVGNCIDPNMHAVQENFATLSQRLDAPCLGFIPHLDFVTPQDASLHLDIRKLL
ncbi:MAG: dethiobiotin synthase, partial [Cellvibrionaceae bacterium]|nr:dethiobiotin synthase [Cellvibrionaceae bacterium]